ncbi:MAG: PaaI family thioesterase [Sphingobium sp.]|uniref:PaaI family thioesterase n=1 Tax=Sphingobium sp. TaxID=1912891 RepID=UPI0029B37D4E|nr:PaaI family thioesterase [Sphingobium sp.]MDX3908644.1 PaaI family thioesterase [Sphingobium sp.]
MPYARESPSRITFRIDLPELAGNRLGGLHGGFLASVAENCLGLFLALEGRARDAVTVSLSFDYSAAGQVGAPVEGELELIRETGRMQFLRIVLRQGDTVLLHGQGVLRKLKAA